MDLQAKTRLRAGDEWWTSMSPEAQKQYLKDHPNSEKAEQAREAEKPKGYGRVDKKFGFEESDVGSEAYMKRAKERESLPAAESFAELYQNPYTKAMAEAVLKKLSPNASLKEFYHKAMEFQKQYQAKVDANDDPAYGFNRSDQKLLKNRDAMDQVVRNIKLDHPDF